MYGVSGLVLRNLSFLNTEPNGELLYNGIQLPAQWPPRNINPQNYDPMDVPYLASPPRVIPINVGRQLFVDDFLIEKTTLTRQFYTPKKIDSNPIFKPETPLEHAPFGIPGATPKDGGIWWDPKDKLFKMWYEAGWLYTMAYATSEDGINWVRPELDIDHGTNRIFPEIAADSSTVFIDYDTKNENERFKMFLRPPNTVQGVKRKFNRGYVAVSPDGIHWTEPLETGICGDRTTIFYNPFRKKWVFSLRNTGEFGKSSIGRSRYYLEHDDFLKGAKWETAEPVFWTGADRLDLPDPEIGDKAQLYNLSAVGYESIMLGMHQIHLGPDNEICLKAATPKITELKISFSRDGFHWDRPNRDVFIKATRKQGDWDRGYVQSVGGICTVVGDQLRIHYIGFKGDESKKHSVYVKNGMHSFGSAGIAVLRRDGFASMKGDRKGGELTSRVVTFDGRYLFVNANCKDGELKVEVLNEDGSVIRKFSAANCVPVKVDSTIHQVSWKGGDDLSSLSKKKVKFRFHLKNGELYAFWVSPEQSGASHGYNAAGGPGFNGPTDVEGILAYEKASSYTKF